MWSRYVCIHTRTIQRSKAIKSFALCVFVCARVCVCVHAESWGVNSEAALGVENLQ